jgi:hypothetical protein
MASFIKTYSIAKKKKTILLAGVCLLCAFVVPLLGSADIVRGFSSGDWTVFVMSLLWFFFWSVTACIFYKWALTAKLIISESKIECDDIASLVGFSTAWENIESIFVSKMRLVLYLKKPSEPSTKLGEWVIAHHWISPNVIVLSSFIEYWKSGELKQDFKRCAPYLLEEDRGPKSNPA